jgi:hypothetical protein
MLVFIIHCAKIKIVFKFQVYGYEAEAHLEQV